MLELICSPASAEVGALIKAGASRLASIDPRLAKLKLSIAGASGTDADGTEAHLELLLPEHQLILNRRHLNDAAAVREAFDAAAVSLQAIAERDKRES